MARALRERGVEFDEAEVDDDPALEARYGDLVPVLLDAHGGEICHHFLDHAALRKALAG